jgi:hypothetical protein
MPPVADASSDIPTSDAKGFGYGSAVSSWVLLLGFLWSEAPSLEVAAAGAGVCLLATSFGGTYLRRPRFESGQGVRIWTTFGFRRYRIVPVSPFEVVPHSFLRFSGEVTAVTVQGWTGVERRRKLRATVSSSPRSAAQARLAVERAFNASQE